MTSPRRGPAAAGDNRVALLSAARRLFAEQGYAVPISTIARAAGVGQGTIYRHFPTREDLARAVVQESLAELGALVEQADPAQAFGEVWREVVRTLVDQSGFLDAALGPRGELDGSRPARELRELLAQPLAAARAAGLVDGDLTLDDVMLTLSMVHGATHRWPDRESREGTAYRALALVGRGLQLR